MNGSPGSIVSMAWLQALRQPEQTLDWTLPQWERVLRLSRRLRLLGRLAESVEAAGLTASVPAPVARHLQAELRYSRWRTRLLLWGLERLPAMMGEPPYPLVLLKGAAYVVQGLPIASGRLPSDIDILVPREHLADAQERLLAAGWAETALDDHDRRYYHEWSHEVPPMRHALHGLELDLHHNILPPVAHTRVDIALLLARLQPSPSAPWQVFHPQDQVLHSAAHLFHDSDARDRLRDLVDLDGLLRHFDALPGFWQGLPARASALGLNEPLALACHFATLWLRTPVPETVLMEIQRAGPSASRRAWLHAMLSAVLTPTEPDQGPSARQDLAALALLVRHHWRRMPLGILLPHLWHKWRTGRKVASDDVLAARADG